jgi:hypothetical protein
MELCGGFCFFLVDITWKLDALFAIATSGPFGKIEASLNDTLFFLTYGCGFFLLLFIFIKLNLRKQL